VIIHSITFGSAVVDSMVVYSSIDTSANVIPPEELSAVLSSSPGSIFKPDFQDEYSVPEVSGTVEVKIPSTPPASPPPPPSSDMVQSSLSVGVSANGNGTRSSPVIVRGDNITLDLNFQVLNSKTNLTEPAGVTGVHPSGLVVSDTLLTRDTHFILDVKGVSPTDEVNSVSVELQAIGEWPACTESPYTLGISFVSDSATLIVDNGTIVGVAASNTLFISWSPGEKHLAQCLPTTAPTVEPTADPIPTPTGALPVGAHLSFNIEFSDEDMNTLKSDEFQDTYIAGMAVALVLRGGESVEVEDIRGDNVVATLVIFPLQDGLEERVSEVKQVLEITEYSEMDSGGTGLSLLRYVMAQAGYTSPIVFDKNSTSTAVFVPPPPPTPPSPSPTIRVDPKKAHAPPPAPTSSDDSTRTTNIIAASVSAGLVAVVALGAAFMMYRWKQRQVVPEDSSTNGGGSRGDPRAEPMLNTEEDE